MLANEPARELHVVGIHQGHPSPVWISGLEKSPAQYRGVCGSCGWRGAWIKDPKEAQADAMEHRGGTLRTRERRRSGAMPETLEMFPEASL